MIPQNQGVINDSYFNSVIDQINNATSCNQLKDIVSQFYTSIAATQQASLQQQQLLGGMQSLLEAPTTPDACVTYLSNFIQLYLGPALAPYQTYLQQNIALTAKLGSVANAVSNASSKFPNCSVTIPT